MVLIAETTPGMGLGDPAGKGNSGVKHTAFSSKYSQEVVTL